MDEITVDEFTVDEYAVDEFTVDKFAVDEFIVDDYFRWICVDDMFIRWFVVLIKCGVDELRCRWFCVDGLT